MNVCFIFLHFISFSVASKLNLRKQIQIKEAILLSNGSVFPSSLANKCPFLNNQNINKILTTQNKSEFLIDCSAYLKIQLYYESAPTAVYKYDDNLNLISIIVYRKKNYKNYTEKIKLFKNQYEIDFYPGEEYYITNDNKDVSIHYNMGIFDEKINFDFPMILESTTFNLQENKIQLSIDTKSDNFSSAIFCIESSCEYLKSKNITFIVRNSKIISIYATFVLFQGNTEVYYFQYDMTKNNKSNIFYWVSLFLMSISLIIISVIILIVRTRIKNNLFLGQFAITKQPVLNYIESPRLHRLNTMFGNH